MSTAEVILGANLYKDAVDADLKSTMDATPEDYGNLRLAFRDMSRWLIRHDCVARDEDGKWDVNNAGIDKVDDEQAKKFLPLYQTAVLAHEQSKSALTRDGKADYMASFRDIHADTIFEIEPETVTRVRGSDMQDITTASLNLLETVEGDRANAAFIPGLDQASLDSLWSVLEETGYLMPGENPDREAALGAQALRGTPEQQEALYFQASAIATNLDLPESINQGDKSAAAAMVLKNAVSSAEVEEVNLEGLGVGSAEMGWDSDLTKKDANSLFNVIVRGTRMIHGAQWDTQSLDTVVVHQKHAEDMKIALDDYYEKGIDNALSSGNFGDPVIGIDQARRLGKAIDFLNEAINTDPDAQRYTGDDGGLMTQEGQTMSEGNDLGDEFGGAFDAEESAPAAVAVSGDGDMAAHAYGKSETKVRLTEGLLSEADTPILEAIDSGAAEYLRQRAGRAESELGDIGSTRAAFGTLEEAIGGEGQAYEMRTESAGRSGEVVTLAEKANMNPEKRERLVNSRRVIIKPGQDPFRDYKPGAPDVAAKRMTKYLDDNMLVEGKDGKMAPNLKLRAELRNATQMRIESTTRGEGEAFLGYARKFVERDREEQRLREEAGREKRGISQVDLDAKSVGRFLEVYAASGSRDPARMEISPEGQVGITHPDAPKLTSRMSEVPSEIAKSPSNPARRFGGNLDVESLKAAYQTGAEKLTLMVDGEHPYGVIGKFDDQPVKTKTKKVEDIVLS